ncbi:hypothetical protein BV898_14007 [Hypsibius exemplaris]|uniref:Apple domain-containing protein n=1 Tax=Hypsibius exemplaris TaxID=2072580 RepID=A0A1W0W903_HYPEX|nr:hypothetical protein BV898_14007 [Hypsibius exemplaris]
MTSGFALGYLCLIGATLSVHTQAQTAPPPPPSSAEDNGSGGSPVVIFSKRCTTNLECNWGFECKAFDRVLTPGKGPVKVQNCAECRPSCRSDAECKQPTNPDGSDATLADPGDRLKCFHGCCKPKKQEREIMRMPILRGAPEGHLRRLPVNMPNLAESQALFYAMNHTVIQPGDDDVRACVRIGGLMKFRFIRHLEA